jgi:hypothetical protein
VTKNNFVKVYKLIIINQKITTKQISFNTKEIAT